MLFETIVLEWKIFIVFLINNNKIIDNDTHRERTVINPCKWESYNVSLGIYLYNFYIKLVFPFSNYAFRLNKDFF